MAATKSHKAVAAKPRKSDYMRTGGKPWYMQEVSKVTTTLTLAATFALITAWASTAHGKPAPKAPPASTSVSP